MNNEQNVVSNEPKKKGKKTIILILILVLIILGGYFVYDKVFSNNTKVEYKNKGTDKGKEDKTVKISLDFGDVKAFGVIEKQDKPNNVTMEIVAYTTDDKIVNIYTIDKDFLKSIITEGNVIYETKNVNIDYYQDKLYIELRNQLYSIDLKASEYKLDKIDVPLPNNGICTSIDVVDGTIYFNYSANKLMYNIGTKQLSNLPENIEDFVIKKDTKQIIYTDKYVIGKGQSLYWASLSSLNSPNLIYKTDYNPISYFNYYNDNVVFRVPTGTNALTDPDKVKIYNLSSEETKDTSLPSNPTIMVIDNELYYAEQTSTLDSNGYATALTLKIYKYNNSASLIYTFNTGSGGNFAEYAGGNKILLIDNSGGKNKMIDTSGKEINLIITNLDDSTNILDLNDNYRIKFEYAK